ncbi:MAG: Stp1/IreP family PP2C-type Ser/Thr phosphatase [Oscillospiraceae bacterium]|nr:Stp1/IreP family PP2C-type Ser/Thr phosphatase [Oscillospiraceae bacterium]
MIKLWGTTDKGAVRQQNQDGYSAEQYGDSLAAAVVCDGMGGARAGNVASAIAVATFVSEMERLKQCPPEAPEALLKQVAISANRAVHTQASENIAYAGMGTTMVAAIVTDECAYLLNIGDSRAYYIGKEGISRITRDHSYVEDLVARGDITREEARYHPQKNLITRALGSMPNVRSDSFEQKLSAGDYILLCSDGLSNVLTDQEILYEVLHGGEPESCCLRLIELVLERGAPDNVTAVLIERS